MTATSRETLVCMPIDIVGMGAKQLGDSGAVLETQNCMQNTTHCNVNTRHFGIEKPSRIAPSLREDAQKMVLDFRTFWNNVVPWECCRMGIDYKMGLAASSARINWQRMLGVSVNVNGLSIVLP